ncbi:MAG: hypothetical protein HYV90_04255 [Candidatus Woesebacteria bacterium]|nr:MAG: hypothetical protein HYV90_04255 [Candidatus Woesebacteria bacterium]
MKERKPRFISIARVNAMIGALSDGANADDLQSAANMAERRITDKKGRQSESNFVRISKKIPEIKQIDPGTSRENREWNTDFWIVFREPIHGRKMLPLEVKSSDFGVREVKNGKDFKRNELVLVVNSGKRRQDAEIIKDFREELNRVSALLANLKS